MQRDDESARRANFIANYPSWLIVRHFLDAGLARELFVAMLDKVSKQNTQLHDIVDEVFIGGKTALANWTMRPKYGNAVLNRYFIRLLQSWMWQGDGDPGVYNLESGEPFARELTEINFAFGLSAIDLPRLEDYLSNANISTVRVEPFIAAARSVQALLAGDRNVKPESLAKDLIGATDDVLGGLLVKHLGDLCVDEDAWQAAAIFYGISNEHFAALTDEVWRDLINVMRAITAQSVASAARMLDGPSASVKVLSRLIDNADVRARSWPVIAMNATPDLMRAYSEAREFGHEDRRGATLMSPQIVDQHDLQSAITNSVNGKFRDAHRFFWAVLRRQTALGSSNYSSVTRAHYGKSIIDELIASLGRDMDQRGFNTGLRLLIEGVEPDIIDRVGWSGALIDAYVTEVTIAEISERAERAPGLLKQRVVTVVHLFSKWLIVNPIEKPELARRMIVFIARQAIENRRNINSRENVGGDALKALREVARERPEYRALEAFTVSRAVLSHLMSGDGLAIEEAIKTATAFVNDFEPDVLIELVEIILGLIDHLNGGGMGWSIARATIVFLDSPAVMSLAAKEPDLGKRLVAALLRLCLEISPDQDALMYILRKLPPALIEGQVNEAKLNSVVEGLRKQALQTNSTGASESIRALLIAPGLAKLAGVEDAIAGLKQILLSATGNDTSLSFGDAYHPLLVLAERRVEIAEALGLSEAEGIALVQPVFQPLMDMWVTAPSHPEIFNGFSFPPKTMPNSTVVHNWTFASSSFASSLGRLPELLKVMEPAFNAPLLGKPMAVARAIRQQSDGNDLFDLHTIGGESKDAFYAVLGQRLAALNDVPDVDLVPVIQMMIDQCLRYGPEGIDAGLFVIATRSNFKLKVSTHAAESYRERLLANRALRLSLTPLFERLRHDE